MKKDNDTITVYWAPSGFTEDNENWNFLYSNPVSALADLNAIRNKSSNSIFSCPAYKHTMKNVFVFKNSLPEKIKLDEEVFLPKVSIPFYHFNRSKILLSEVRESSFNQHVNLIYGMSWLFFADQPVEARFTAPYFPTVSPALGAMLATGQFDIGRWYRDYVLDYHIPFGTKELTFEENQPLFYLELMTDKKVIFKRYNLTRELKRIAEESSSSPSNYGLNRSLLDKYNMFKRSSSPERVLSHIKQNLVE